MLIKRPVRLLFFQSCSGRERWPRRVAQLLVEERMTSFVYVISSCAADLA